MASGLSTILDRSLELIYHILTYLEHPDILAFSLVSHASRLSTLPELFGRKQRPMRLGSSPFFSNGKTVEAALSIIEGASEQLRNSVRAVYINSFSRDVEFQNRLFRCLATLKNLERINTGRQALYRKDAAALSCKDVAALVTLCENLHKLDELDTSLDFSLDEDVADDATGPFQGPSGLKILSVRWEIMNSFSGLVAFIGPSVPTLISLSLSLQTDGKNALKHTWAPLVNLDFLAGAGANLRTFKLELRSFDPRFRIGEVMLESICRLFPKLRELTVVWELCDTPGLTWDDKFINAFSALTQLKKLRLSVDFEEKAADEFEYSHNMRWYWRCLSRRHEVTRKLADACPNLEMCVWRHLGIDSEGNEQEYPFAVRRRSDGRTVVKYAKQWWMEYAARDRSSPVPLPSSYEDDVTSDGEVAFMGDSLTSVMRYNF